MICGSIAEKSCLCYWAFPSGIGGWRRVGLLCREEASSRSRTMMYRWIRSWLCGGPRWITAAEPGACAVLSAVAKRTVLSGAVPGPRGIVTGQSGVVSSFLMCPVRLFFLTCFLLVASVEWTQPSQAKLSRAKSSQAKRKHDTSAGAPLHNTRHWTPDPADSRVNRFHRCGSKPANALAALVGSENQPSRRKTCSFSGR